MVKNLHFGLHKIDMKPFFDEYNLKITKIINKKTTDFCFLFLFYCRVLQSLISINLCNPHQYNNVKYFQLRMRICQGMSDDAVQKIQSKFDN